MVPPPASPADASGASPASSSNGFIGSTLHELGLDNYLERISPMLTEYGFRAIGAIIFLIIAMFFAKWMGGMVRRGLERARIEATLVSFLAKFTRIAILVLAVVTCLSIFGVPSTMFATVIGASGLAIGLALQGSLSNIAAGAMLAIFRPFRLGDFVALSDCSGTVVEVDLFTTRLNTPDNRRIILPNSQVFGKVIENFTYNPIRRAEVKVGVDYGADLDDTRRVLEAAVMRTPGRVDDPAPKVVLDSFGDSAVNWIIHVWAAQAQLLNVRQAAAREVWYALEQAGIGIPFPQHVVHMAAPLRVERQAAPGEQKSS